MTVMSLGLLSLMFVLGVIVPLNVVLMSALMASRFYCYAVPHSAECRNAVCHCADYHYAKCHYAECCGAAGRERDLPNSEEQTYVCANINKPY